MMRLKGGVLSFTIYVSIVIAIILTSMLLAVYYSNISKKSYEIRFRLMDNVRSAEQWALANLETLSYGEAISFDLFDQGIDSVSITKHPWGVMDVITASASHRNALQLRAFIAGWNIGDTLKSALYLTDEGRPLSLVGDSKIEGDVYLPLAGVQSAYIGRVGYTNEDLIFGDERRSAQTLPELNLKGLEAFRETYEQLTTIPDVNTHSFLSDTVGLIRGINLHIEDTISGKIVIRGGSSLSFDSLSRTEDIIGISDVIRFESGFRGSGQFFVTDTLIVEGDVSLRYPTVIILEGSSGIVKLESGSSVNGMIIIHGEDFTFRQRFLEIEAGAELEGLCYVNGMLSHTGDVKGHAMTRRFLVNNFDGVFENYLYNGSISSESFDSLYVVPNLWGVSDTKRILKWVR